MKLCQIIILSLSIIMIKNTDFCDSRIVATGPKDCKNLRLSTEYDDCCYFEGIWNGVYKKSCIDLTPVRKEKTETEKYRKKLNENENYDIEKIICNSAYIRIYYIYLILFIIF